MKPEWLAILACPETHQPLAPADSMLLDTLNTRARAGTLKNRGAKLVESPIDGGLLRSDGKVMYPIYKDLPVLLVEEGIEVDQ